MHEQRVIFFLAHQYISFIQLQANYLCKIHIWSYNWKTIAIHFSPTCDRSRKKQTISKVTDFKGKCRVCHVRNIEKYHVIPSSDYVFIVLLLEWGSVTRICSNFQSY